MKWMIEGISFSFRKIEFFPLEFVTLPFLGCKGLCCKKLQEAIGVDFKGLRAFSVAEHYGIGRRLLRYPVAEHYGIALFLASFPHLHTCVVKNYTCVQCCRGEGWGEPGEYKVGDLFLCPLVWQSRSIGRFAIAIPPPPQGVGKQSATLTAGEQACRILGASQRTLILRAPCLRTTFDGMRYLRAVGYAHRSKHFPAGKGECSRAAEPVKATPYGLAHQALTEPAALHRRFDIWPENAGLG